MDHDALTRFRRAYWQGLLELDNLRLAQWEHANLTLPQLRLLLQVRRTPGITIGRLADRMPVTVSTVSGLVTKLVDRGLLERTASEDDRRQVPLQLTDAGRIMAGEIIADVLPFLDAVAADLGGDLAQTTECLQRLAEAARRVREASEREAPAS